MSAHTTITSDGAPMADWPHAVQVAMKDPRVAGAAPYIEIQAMLSGPRVQGAIVQGIDPALEPKVSVISEKVKKGRFDGLTPPAATTCWSGRNWRSGWAWMSAIPCWSPWPKCRAPRSARFRG